MAKNGTPKAAGKAGTYTVSASLRNGQAIKDVAVNVTAEAIATVRKAIAACNLPPYTNKKGQLVTPKGAHTTFTVTVNGVRVRFGNVLLAIAAQHQMLASVNGESPEGLKGDPRKLVMRLITGALEEAGVIKVRASGFGAMIYLPENAPESTDSDTVSGAEALAAIMAS